MKEKTSSEFKEYIKHRKFMQEFFFESINNGSIKIRGDQEKKTAEFFFMMGSDCLYWFLTNIVAKLKDTHGPLVIKCIEEELETFATMTDNYRSRTFSTHDTKKH